MRTTLLVFDIDGTLIRTRAGRVAFNRAFERVFGLREAAGRVDMAGRTDPAIYRSVCEAHGLDPSAFDRWKHEFVAELVLALEAYPVEPMPGVGTLLEACNHEPGFRLALGTGNVEEGARLKLAAGRLSGFFPTGGFGADGVTRADVIASAIARAEELQQGKFDRVIVIGDTPHDIDCGKANRGRTVAVATGPYTTDALTACGPDLVLPNFTQTAAVMEHFRCL